jgi:group I intron endonuclease
MIIYKTTCLINNKIYVGQDHNDNPDYLGSGKILKQAIKKYGKENFRKDTIESCENQAQLDAQEIHWIKELDATNPEIGYNIANGGSGSMVGRKHTAITRKKMSVAKKGRVSPNKGKKFSEAHRKKIGEASRNRMTLALKARISKIQKERKRNKMTKETKEKMKLAKLGKKRKPFTVEHKKHMSKSYWANQLKK